MRNFITCTMHMRYSITYTIHMLTNVMLYAAGLVNIICILLRPGQGLPKTFSTTPLNVVETISYGPTSIIFELLVIDEIVGSVDHRNTVLDLGISYPWEHQSQITKTFAMLVHGFERICSIQRHEMQCLLTLPFSAYLYIFYLGILLLFALSCGSIQYLKMLYSIREIYAVFQRVAFDLVLRIDLGQKLIGRQKRS